MKRGLGRIHCEVGKQEVETGLRKSGWTELGIVSRLVFLYRKIKLGNCVEMVCVESSESVCWELELNVGKGEEVRSEKEMREK